MRRSTPFYELVVWLQRTFLKPLFRWQIHGLDKVPDGGLIFAGNHVSVYDPPFISAAIPRRKIDWMAKRPLYDLVFVGTWLRWLDTIPVTQETADLGAMKEALRRLRAGRAIGIFPEGGISPDGTLHEGHHGVSILAHRAHVPVVPVGITGTAPLVAFDRRRLRLSTVRIRFGDPIPAPEARRFDDNERAAYTSRVMEAIDALVRQNRDEEAAGPK